MRQRFLAALPLLRIFDSQDAGSAAPPSIEDARRCGITTIGSSLVIGAAVSVRLQLPLVHAERYHGPPQILPAEAFRRVQATFAVA
jgi:hypothetical protein